MSKIVRCIDGSSFVIDDADFGLVRLFSWRVTGRTRGKGGAVKADISLGKLLLLEELVETSKKIVVRSSELQADHINGNPFDNRRQNLRVLTRSENNHHKWKRIAIRRLLGGINCQRKGCSDRAVKLVHRASRRYAYLCKSHDMKGKLIEIGN